ncbi:coiled-coil domain-containing protein R3HCC1L [Trichonephila clavata]|uniref:Coiled-coil domain-containing protein R3HCC1L n=1 Tax=Trichonephila clavata TaxID=2740835 RepID=A0A8X6IR64_TRICU|nr:coiled-coil domain-containing protein R3HCC1L [Trichonephila clavata]
MHSCEYIQNTVLGTQRAFSNYEPIFTDGSKSESHVGSAVVSLSTVITDALPISASIYTAELHALRIAIEHISLSCGRKISDFGWIPGHAGITGNELADTAARSATGSSERFPIPHSDLKACFRQKLQSCWQSNWDQQTENKLHSIMPILAPTVPSSSNRREQLNIVTGQIKVRTSRNDYSEYQPISDNVPEEYENIVELYNFPKEFNTQDLVSALSMFQQSCYCIKWVDDCHALAVFTSPAIANQALLLTHPFVKARPLSEGLKESKAKARWCARHSEPPKPRPATTAALARRLVSGALGLKVQATKEQKELERNMLKNAREKRRQKAKQQEAIWEGVTM